MNHRPGGVFLDPGSSAQHIVRPDKPKLGWSLEQRKVYYKSHGRRMGGGVLRTFDLPLAFW